MYMSMHSSPDVDLILKNLNRMCSAALRLTVACVSQSIDGPAAEQSNGAKKICKSAPTRDLTLLLHLNHREE